MAHELMAHPPGEVEYSLLKPEFGKFRMLRSPIKGFMRDYHFGDHDIIEAILSPVATNRKWILSLSNFQEAVAFNFLGIPIPLPLRVSYITSLLRKESCKKIYFWSHAGHRTLTEYGKVTDETILRKTMVIYPGVRTVSQELIRFSDRTDNVNLLFSGYFFRKGGMNVIDAFETLQQKYPNIKLRMCCSESIDFVTPNESLKKDYLDRIKSNPGITMARASREELYDRILPETDIFLIPTYVETFGFAILEAMSFGLPIISTTHFAIPEMIEHEHSGLLIDTSAYDCDSLFKGYTVNHVPVDFREHITQSVTQQLLALIESPELRKKLGMQALNTARNKFSIDNRNAIMTKLYREIVNESE